MIEQVEISSFDLRYESYRMKNPKAEKMLLISIQEQEIREPLQGVDSDSDSTQARIHILLNGFKRYRCAKMLNIDMVPYYSLGSDEAFGIINLLRIANSKNLNILEQARLIDELANVHKMNVNEISQLLEKSCGWVSMRLGMFKQMSPFVIEKIFKGEFPAYSYMYTLRQFMRMKEVRKEEIDRFVDLVSGKGKGLSIRDIDILANGYFKGSDELRQQIEAGSISWSLGQLKESSGSGSDCTEFERRMLRHLESIVYLMDKISYQSTDNRLKSPTYCAQANLVSGKILKKIEGFKHSLEELYDRTGEKKCSVSASPSRNKSA